MLLLLMLRLLMLLLLMLLLLMLRLLMLPLLMLLLMAINLLQLMTINLLLILRLKPYLQKKAVPQPNVAEAALQKIEEEGRMALKSSAPAPATPSIHGSNNAHDQMVDNALSAFTSQETSVKSPSEVLVAATQASAELVFWKYFALLMVSFNVCGFSIWAYNSSKSWDADLRSQKRPLL